MPLDIRQKPLPDDEYIRQQVPKIAIYLHHTAGGHRPDWVVDGWMADRTDHGAKRRVATAWVIGGPSSSSGDTSWDGVVVRCFDDHCWAYHLGLRTDNRLTLESCSVGIELCNYGPLTRTADGRFLSYVNREVPGAQAVDLGAPFRGFQFYQRYSGKQLAALRELLVDIANRHSIDLRRGLPALLRSRRPFDAFGIQQAALEGKPGLWTHTNVRSDKYDCFPQPEIIDLLLSL
jgi:hypothetical protein